jgi:hypothetical protein
VGALRLPVFIASWQIECCWEPPAVGDLISWHLVFVEEQDGDQERRGLVQLDATASLIGQQDEPFEGRWAQQLDAPGLCLYWMAPRRALGRQRHRASFTRTTTPRYLTNSPRRWGWSEESRSPRAAGRCVSARNGFVTVRLPTTRRLPRQACWSRSKSSRPASSDPTP